MKVWYSTQFEGHWPVGCAAVVVAETREDAAIELEVQCIEHCIPQSIDPDTLIEIDLSVEQAIILNDGNC